MAFSALHQIYVARGARIETLGPWQVPADFSDVNAEAAAARRAVAIGENCGAAVWEIEGQELGELAARLGVEKVKVGSAASVTFLVHQEARWCRLTPSRARLLMDWDGARSSEGSMGERKLPAPLVELLAEPPYSLQAGRACLHVTDTSSGLTTLMLLGPASPDLLARMLRLDLDPRVFVNHTLALTGAVGVPVQLLRWDHGPLLAYEIMVGRDVAEYFWEVLIHTGEGLGLTPIGAEALARLLAADEKAQPPTHPPADPEHLNARTPERPNT